MAMAKREAFPSEKQDQYMLRMPDGMRERLKAEAAINKRSLNAEIIDRLEASFLLEQTIREHEADSADMRAQMNRMETMMATLIEMRNDEQR